MLSEEEETDESHFHSGDNRDNEFAAYESLWASTITTRTPTCYDLRMFPEEPSAFDIDKIDEGFATAASFGFIHGLD